MAPFRFEDILFCHPAIKELAGGKRYTVGRKYLRLSIIS